MPKATEAGFSGNQLLALRTAKGWSQEELAKEAGLTNTSISFFENGLRMPSGKTIRALARALEVERSDLLAAPEPLDDHEVALLQEYRQLPAELQELFERIIGLFREIGEEQREDAMRRRRWRRRMAERRRRALPEPRRQLSSGAARSEESPSGAPRARDPEAATGSPVEEEPV